jgi:hypothetical protein
MFNHQHPNQGRTGEPPLFCSLIDLLEGLRVKANNTALAFLGEFIAFSMAYIVTLRMGKCMIFQEDSAKLPKQ